MIFTSLHFDNRHPFAQPKIYAMQTFLGVLGLLTFFITMKFTINLFVGDVGDFHNSMESVLNPTTLRILIAFSFTTVALPLMFNLHKFG